MRPTDRPCMMPPSILYGGGFDPLVTIIPPKVWTSFNRYHRHSGTFDSLSDRIAACLLGA